MIRLLALVLLVAGCTTPPKPFECDAHGRFVITDDMPGAVQLDLLNRNIELNTLRIQAMGGERWIDPDRLVKARGCP